MCAVSIKTNLASMRGQRLLGEANSAYQQSLERLSTGQRINRASDDAAGLSVADSLNLTKRVYTQGVRNVNDGLSALSIADQTLGQLDGIVVRLLELSEQASNGSYSARQRSALNREAQQLSQEYTRLISSTSFNGMNLFGGSAGQINIQAGFGTSGVIQGNIGGGRGTGSYSLVSTAEITIAVALGDLNGDGFDDLVSHTISNLIVRLSNGDGTFSSPSTFVSVLPSIPQALKLSDVNGDGALDVIANMNGRFQVSLNDGSGRFTVGQSINLGGVVNDYQLGDINNDGRVDLVSTANAGNIAILYGNGDGTFQAATTLSTNLEAINSLSLSDMNGDGSLEIIAVGREDGGMIVGDETIAYATLLNNGGGNFTSSVSSTISLGDASQIAIMGDLNGDGILDLLTSSYSAIQDQTYNFVSFGTASGTFTNKVSTNALFGAQDDTILADLNGDGKLDLVSGDGFQLGLGNGNFTGRTPIEGYGTGLTIAAGDFNRDGVVDLAGAKGSLSYMQQGSTQGASALQQFSLNTIPEARSALTYFKTSQTRLALQRGVLGASISRTNFATGLLGGAAEHYAAAEGRIRDADIAEESSKLVRLGILQNAATAILAQANQSQGIALKILGIGEQGSE